MRDPKILLLDIETSPMLEWGWRYFESNALKVEQPAMVLMVGYKWLNGTGSGKAKVISMDQFKDYKPGRFILNDYNVCLNIHKIILEADYVVAHYGGGFDNPMLMNRFIFHNLGPIPARNWIDTKREAAKIIKAPTISLSLANIALYFEIGQKIETNLSLWFDCMDGDKAAWREMRKYCQSDVDLLGLVYLKMRPYLENTPNMALWRKGIYACPACGSVNIQRRGIRRTQVSEFQQYQCQDCGRWSRERTRNPDTAPIVVPLR